MDQEQLETFLTLAETSSFTKTSEILNVVQSTVTSRIKTLETQLDKKLFERGTRYVRLSPDGQAFISNARKIVNQMQKAITELQLREKYDYRIIIGGLSIIWDSTVYSFIEELCNRGNISIRLVTDHSAHLVNRLQEGSIDVAYVLIPPRSSYFEKQLVRKERIILVGNCKYYGDKQTFSRKELLHSRKLLYQNWGIPYEEWFCHEFGDDAETTLRVDHSGLALKLIKNLDYIGFMSESMAKELIDEGILKEIEYQSKRPIPELTIYLTYLKSRARELSLQSFLAFTKNIL